MTKGIDENADPKELCIPQYLNQKIVFDLLAIQEDGFSKLSTLITSSSDSEGKKHSGGGSIGVSNIFALLGITFSSEYIKEKETGLSSNVTQEKVHTPTSLFAKFRMNLIKNNLLLQNITDENFNDIKSGDFIEFRAVLRKNPIIDILEWLKTFGETIAPIYQSQNTTGSSQQPKIKNPFDKTILQQIDLFLSMIKPAGSIELIGDLIGGEIKSVISCQPEFFNNNFSEIIDGEFSILGKVVKTCDQASSGINLLRKTPLGRMDPDVFKQLEGSFSGIKNSGIKCDEIKIVIEAPSMLIIPIAIFL